MAFPLSLPCEQWEAYPWETGYVSYGKKTFVIFYKVRNMIVSEKLHCKIPWVEELRFSDSPVLI